MFRRVPPAMPGEKSGDPRWLKKRHIIIAVIAFFLVVQVSQCLVYIRPNECGIKEVKVGVHRGIHSKIYTPGFAFVVPFGVERMHRFPNNIQVLELTAVEPHDSRNSAHNFSRAAKIQTSDGFFVDVDVTVLFRIADAYKVMTTLGPGTLFLESGILPKVEPVLKQTLGELKTEDFYNSPMRVERVERAKAQLNSEMDAKGLHVEHILVRYFKYTDEIQKNIESRKLQDQFVFKNQAEARAATEAANLAKVTREGEMKVRVTLQEGQSYKMQKEGERELYTRKRIAEADLLGKVAEADATELKNKAMQTQGNDLKVAMEMAKVLQGLDTVVVPSGSGGLNPLNLDSVISLFGLDLPSATADPKVPLKADAPPPPPPPAPEPPVMTAPAPVPAPALEGGAQ